MLREIVFDSCWELVQTFGFSEALLLRHWCRFRNLHLADEDDPSLVASSVWNSTVLRFREGASLMFVPECVLDVRERLELVSPASRLPASRVETTPSRPEAGGGSESSSLVATPVTTTTRLALTVVPEFIRRDVAVTALRDVVRSTVVPRKFHCVARFARLWPSDVAKLAKSQPGTDAAFVYSFVVRLEDDTDSIDVIVHGKDAVRRELGLWGCARTSTANKRIGMRPTGALLARSPTVRPEDQYELTRRAGEAARSATEQPAGAALLCQGVRAADCNRWLDQRHDSVCSCQRALSSLRHAASIASIGADAGEYEPNRLRL